jgi:hypothetical protein
MHLPCSPTARRFWDDSWSKPRPNAVPALFTFPHTLSIITLSTVMSRNDYARSRFESICAGEYCQPCQTPTIVSSVGGVSVNEPCECIRDRPKEWLLAARMSSIAPNSLIVVGPDGAPTTTGGKNQVRNTVTASSRSEGEALDAKRLKDMSHAVAKFALTNAGYGFVLPALEDVRRLEPPASGTSFAEYSGSLSKQVTTVFGATMPRRVKESESLAHFDQYEIDLIVQQLRSRPESLSCQAYNSILRRIPERATAVMREVILNQALARVKPDAQDILPNQSALSASFTATESLSQMESGAGISASKWL